MTDTPRAKRGSVCRELDPIDLTPCARCHIRGHEPGDPEKCIQSSALYQRGAGGAGLGGMWWV